jgi:hypothetical protein
MIIRLQTAGALVALALSLPARQGWADDPCLPYEVYTACIEDAYGGQPQASSLGNLSEIVAVCWQRAGLPPVKQEAGQIEKASSAPLKSPDELESLDPPVCVVRDPVLRIEHVP